MAETIKGKELIKAGIQKAKLKKKLGNQCVYCGCNNKLILTIDHITPTIRGGKDDDSNKQVTCFLCNQLKGGLTHIEFVKYLKLLQGLKELQKVRLNIEQPTLIFKPEHFPRTEEEIKKNKNWWREKDIPKKQE